MEFERVGCDACALGRAAAACHSYGRGFAEGLRVFFGVPVIFEFGRPNDLIYRASVFVATFAHVWTWVVEVEGAFPAPHRIENKFRRVAKQAEMRGELVEFDYVLVARVGPWKKDAVNELKCGGR